MRFFSLITTNAPPRKKRIPNITFLSLEIKALLTKKIMNKKVMMNKSNLKIKMFLKKST